MSETTLATSPVLPPTGSTAPSLEDTLLGIIRKLGDEKLMDRFLPENEPRQRQDIRGAVRYLHFAMRRFGPLETRLKAAEAMARIAKNRPVLVAWAELLEAAGDKERAVKVARIALTIFYDDVHTQKLFLRCGGGEDYHAKAQDRFCSNPFENFEIYPDGSVHICNCIEIPFAVGNVFTQTAEEIWRSPQAQAIRTSMLDGSFKFCSPMGCWKRFNLPKKSEQSEEFERLKRIGVAGGEMPKHLNLSYDRSCNLSCPSCRNELLMANKAQREKLDIVRDKIVLPLLADKAAETVYVTGSGDAFGSPHFRGILKELCDPRYAHVKIVLGTNGQLITPRLWEEFQPLHARFSDVTISIDGATPATFEKLRRGSTWEKLETSMAVLRDSRRANKISLLVVNMVVQQDNFREMRLLLEKCRDWAVDKVRFYRLRQWGHTDPRSFDERDVSNPAHPDFPSLMEEFSHPDFLEPIVTRYDLFELIEKAHNQKASRPPLPAPAPAPDPLTSPPPLATPNASNLMNADHIKTAIARPSVTLAKYHEIKAQMEGYFADQSAALFDIFLQMQHHLNVRGHMLEIGVYKGRSAAMSAQHLRPDEKFFLIDCSNHLDDAKRNLDPLLQGRGVYHKQRSALMTPESIGLRLRSARWVHIDGGHTGNDVVTDIELCEKLLSDDGVMVLDDFFNPMYPQLTEAVYSYLAQNRYKLTMFLVGYNKAYLSRPGSVWCYRTLMKNGLAEYLRVRSVTDFLVCKTTPTEESACYGIGYRFVDRDYYGLDAAPDMML